jgi:serine/threonine protein kinase
LSLPPPTTLAPPNIFAFGTVIYEMATGKKAFSGKSQASVMAAILKEDPAPMSSLQPVTPPALDRVVRKCLAKEPERRWQTASDLRDELKWISRAGGATAFSAPPSASSSRDWLWLGIWELGSWELTAVRLKPTRPLEPDV